MTESMNINWQDDSSDEDDDYEMRGQALPVTPFDINSVDETAIPLTSQEYLQQVIAQRSKLPQVVHAVVPKDEGSSQSSIAEFFKEEEINPSMHRPSDEWQREQVSNFSDLRYRVEVNREEWTNIGSVNFPRKKEDWFQFLFELSEGVPRNQPYLSTVLAMRNETMENLIKYIVDYVIEDKVSVYQSGTWLFALLACIEAPLCMTLMKKLRDLVRKCRKIREKMDFSTEENKKELWAQNLFICLIYLSGTGTYVLIVQQKQVKVALTVLRNTVNVNFKYAWWTRIKMRKKKPLRAKR